MDHTIMVCRYVCTYGTAEELSLFPPLSKIITLSGDLFRTFDLDNSSEHYLIRRPNPKIRLRRIEGGYIHTYYFLQEK